MAGRVQIVGAVSALALFLLCYYVFGASLGGGDSGGSSSYYGASAVSSFRPARINIAKVQKSCTPATPVGRCTLNQVDT
jgi:hypothetical protein